MHVSVDDDIFRLLTSGLSTENVAQSLAHRIQDGELSKPERHRAMHFIYYSGLHQLFLHTCLFLYQQTADLPWGLLLLLIRQQHLATPLPPEVPDILEAARRSQSLTNLVMSPAFDELFADCQTLKQSVINEVMHEQQLKIQHLTNQLNYFQSQRLLTEEERVLTKLVRMQPNNHTFVDARKRFKEKWARNILSQRQNSQTDTVRIDPLKGPEELLLLKQLAEECMKYATGKPSLLEDLSLMFLFFEDYESAYRLLRKAPESVAIHWLILEILCLHQKYVQAIDYSTYVDRLYAGDPETPFATTYIRAQCFYALGEVETAIQLLKSIVKVRPEYRSSQTLLLYWQGGSQ